MKHPAYAIIGLLLGVIPAFSGLMIWNSARSTIANLDANREQTPAASDIIQDLQASVMGDGYGLTLMIAGCIIVIAGIGAACFARHPESDDLVRDFKRIVARNN